MLSKETGTPFWTCGESNKFQGEAERAVAQDPRGVENVDRDRSRGQRRWRGQETSADGMKHRNREFSATRMPNTTHSHREPILHVLLFDADDGVDERAHPLRRGRERRHTE